MNVELIRRAASWGLWRLAAAGMIVAMLAVAASAQYCTPDQCDECDLRQCNLRCCHEPPEFWVINTRCVPKCRNLDAGFERLSYKRWDAKCRRWVKETRQSFIAQEADKPTLLFSHGNTLKHGPAMESAWDLYRRMRCCPGPKRLVFWSWPAQIAFKRPLLRPRKLIMKNLRVKLVYAEYQGYFMAKLVQQMSLSQRVMVAGHSYGAISAATAAHWLGGGQLRGMTLDGGVAVERPNLRLGMISAAFDNDALIPGKRYGQALVAAEKIYVTRNRRDSTLRRWPEISLRGYPALGVTGVNANRLGQYRNKLCQQTLTTDVGKSHYLGPHLKSTRFVASLCCLSFPNCPNCHAATTSADDDEGGLGRGESSVELPEIQLHSADQATAADTPGQPAAHSEEDVSSARDATAEDV